MQYAFPRFPLLKRCKLQSPKLPKHAPILSILAAGNDDLIVAPTCRAGIAPLPHGAASSKEARRVPCLESAHPTRIPAAREL